MTESGRVRHLFIAEARRQGFEIKKELPDGRFVVTRGGLEQTVNLENLSRDVTRDKDPGRIANFVSRLLPPLDDLPPWTESRFRIRHSVEPTDVELGDTLSERVTDSVRRTLVYANADESRIQYLTAADLADWRVTRQEAEQAARENMRNLLSGNPIQIDKIDNHRLGFFSLESPFKAAMTVTPAFREFAEPKLGWPVYVVIPCRDYAWFFSMKDGELIDRIGSTVVEEYTKSGYPITTEVLEVSDKGIKAIGSYPIP